MAEYATTNFVFQVAPLAESKRVKDGGKRGGETLANSIRGRREKRVRSRATLLAIGVFHRHSRQWRCNSHSHYILTFNLRNTLRPIMQRRRSRLRTRQASTAIGMHQEMRLGQTLRLTVQRTRSRTGQDLCSAETICGHEFAGAGEGVN